MAESYTTGGDAFFSLAEPNRICQCFSPLEPHTLDYVDIELKCGPFTAAVTLEVHVSVLPPDPDHQPLAVSTLQPSPVAPGSVNRWRFEIKARPQLQATERYWLVLYHKPIIIGTAADLLYDSTAATYARGWLAKSNDNGQTWDYEYTMDIIFAEFGDPPLIIPEFQPTVSQWASLGLSFFHCHTDEIIYLITSVPCHLTCYLTDIEPTQHYVSRTIRGIRVPWTTRFSLAPWFSVEQSQPGDTIYHTFELNDWPLNLKRWFSFRGEVDFKLSPSVGPIFTRTPTYETPFREGDFEHWDYPLKMPEGWVQSGSGPGPTVVIREETDVYEGKYSLRLASFNVGTMTQLTQHFCARRWIGKTIKLTFAIKVWFNGNGFFGVNIPDGISFWASFGWMNWMDSYSRTFTVGPNTGISRVDLAGRCNAPPSNNTYFDAIKFTVL